MMRWRNPPFPNDNDDAVDAVDIDPAAGIEEFMHAEIYMPQGTQNEIAKVIGRKRNLDNNHTGHRHQNPICDSQLFTMEFPDGEQQDVAYNILVKHLYSQVDEEGNQYRLIKLFLITTRRRQPLTSKADKFQCAFKWDNVKKETTAG